MHHLMSLATKLSKVERCLKMKRKKYLTKLSVVCNRCQKNDKKYFGKVKKEEICQKHT